jgi:hypothetical protein
MSTRPVDAFFYGLFMDVDLLRATGVTPRNPRRAYVDDFALHIGKRATLSPSAGGRAYGMLIGLTHAELERLYAGPGLEETTGPRRLSRDRSTADSSPPSATTCPSRRRPTSATPTTPRAFGASSASSSSRPNTSPPSADACASAGTESYSQVRRMARLETCRADALNERPSSSTPRGRSHKPGYDPSTSLLTSVVSAKPMSCADSTMSTLRVSMAACGIPGCSAVATL